MTAPAVFWPVLLGLSFLVAGLFTYRRDYRAGAASDAFGLAAFGPVFVGAALATFAGEHFTAASSLAQLVPKWLPARLFIAYFVGVALLAAALSFVARRCVRWASLALAAMFGLFVLLMDLPATIKHPEIRVAWILTAREATFSIGALALFAIVVRMQSPGASRRIATFAKFWLAVVLVFYGTQHLLFPQFSPGVPDTMVTAAWVPGPHVLAYVVGVLLIAFGVMMLGDKSASSGAALAGLLMIVLMIVLYVPQFLLAHTVPEQVNGFNFVFDTMLFAGTALIISSTVRYRLEPVSFAS